MASTFPPFVSTFVPVLHVLCLPYNPVWPIVGGKLLDPSCRRPILLFVALPFFFLYTPLPHSSPSSSLVFVIDHPPSLWILLVVVGKPSRLKANRIFINTTGLWTRSLPTPEVLIVPTVFNSNPHKGDGTTLLAYRVCVCVYTCRGCLRWKATKGIKNLWHSRTRLLPDLRARVNIFFSRDRWNESGKGLLN